MRGQLARPVLRGARASNGSRLLDTAIIGEIIERGAKVTLITRPRRFGKTLNLSMLQHFFAAAVSRAPTKGLFDGLDISRQPGAMAHQGQYPVIFFTFKDLQPLSWQEFEDAFLGMLVSLYRGYPELLDSPRLTATEKDEIQALLKRKAGRAQMADAFRLLSELLNKHYEQ